MAAILEHPTASPTASPAASPTAGTQNAVIDVDIHTAPATKQTLLKYLPQRWQRHHETTGMRGHIGSAYPRANPNAARHDAWPPNGGPPGSDLSFLQEQLLEPWGIEYGIMNPLAGAGGQTNLEYGAALSQALNDWQIEEWVEKDSRMKGSIIVPYEDGQLSAAEIDRAAQHPGFVQILLIVRTKEPLGRRKYHPIYEAAVRHNLPIGIHFGGAGGGPITGAGNPSHYYEDHCGMPQAFQAQVASYIFEGVFEKFPTLQVVLIEGGFAWMPPLMWRLDKTWERLGQETPELTRPPSDYIRSNMWLSTQPMEEPPQRQFFHQLLEQMDMNDRLLFATDYPHWDFDAPDRAIPVKLDAELKHKIMAGNARSLYRFE